MHSDDANDATVHVARMITGARVKAEPEGIRFVPEDRPLKPHEQWLVWEPKTFVPLDADVQAEIAATAQQAIDGLNQHLYGDTAAINDPSVSPTSSPVDAIEQLRERVNCEGYALQQLEEIRRDLRAMSLDKVEPLVNAAIETLATQWVFDRKTYRELTK